MLTSKSGHWLICIKHNNVFTVSIVEQNNYCFSSIAMTVKKKQFVFMHLSPLSVS